MAIKSVVSLDDPAHALAFVTRLVPGALSRDLFSRRFLLGFFHRAQAGDHRFHLHPDLLFLFEQGRAFICQLL